MRRLARHLFTLCSAASLLLCAAVCVLWVRSYFATEWLTYQKTEPSHRFWWKTAFRRTHVGSRYEATGVFQHDLLDCCARTPLTHGGERPTAPGT